ncbi:MAG: hypothetical protein NTV16_01330 [Actinobacteria bacterium]|nr:hypothetical protein [Actinomycetota bacterium]
MDQLVVWANGTYRIRVEAKGPDDPNWQNPAVIEKIYKLINKTTNTDTTITKETESTSAETTTSSSTTTTTAAPVNAPPVEDLSLSSSSAQIGSTVKIHAKATWNSSFCAMRLKIDGNIVYELGSPEFNYDWNTSGCSEGNHTIRLEVAAIGDNDWRNPSVREVTCSLKSPSSSGLNKPTLSSPENGKLIPPGTDVTLNWNSVNGANQYYVEIWGGQYGSNHNNLGGWQGGTSRHIGTISPGNVLWRVKARDGSGNESPWSDEWNFTPQ